VDCRAARFQSVTAPSICPAASVFPSGENATWLIWTPTPGRVPVGRHDSLECLCSCSHSFTVPSAQAVTRMLPLGENRTELTSCVCAVRVQSSRPEGTFHSFMVPYLLPEASVLPSGENVTHMHMPC